VLDSCATQDNARSKKKAIKRKKGDLCELLKRQSDASRFEKFTKITDISNKELNCIKYQSLFEKIYNFIATKLSCIVVSRSKVDVQLLCPEIRHKSKGMCRSLPPLKFLPFWVLSQTYLTS